MDQIGPVQPAQWVLINPHKIFDAHSSLFTLILVCSKRTGKLIFRWLIEDGIPDGRP